MILFTSLFLVMGTAWAQAPVATAEEAVTGLLNRIGGNGAAGLFEIVIDANLAENGKDVFVITAQNGKPCIKGNTQLSVATGINWYLNHYAHVNLTWNNLTTDLSKVNLPVPAGEEKHVCNTTYRYDFNTCTFSYSMAFWTWERWQQEIDWMALHGINAPLNLVGLDVVTRNFLEELGVSESDIDAYIAGPGFIAWFAMNNLEGWGGTIESQGTGVLMQGNPDWWYTRQEKLCKNMLQRMRELGMQPVIPGFSGQIPNSLSNYSISGFSSSDVINGGTWAGGYTRPDILHPNSSSYATLAPIYYKHLEAIMGVSELYSMDPFHEGGLPSAVTNATCYPPIMAALDTYHNAVDDAAKTSYNVGTEDNQAKWIIQYWQNIPQSGAFSAMSSYGDRFIGLDLFSDNIYAGNAAKWRDTGNNCYYQGRPYIYCMLHNFGGRSGMHGRLETTMDGYFQALANNNNCQGIGATPEGTETNPILYDMLFELPWMDVNNRPTADEWLEDYAYARYGVDNATALAALQDLKKSVWDCKVNQQGTSEAVILARPNWTVNSVSSWSTSAIYWDTQEVLQAADKFYSIKDIVTENSGQDGVANYNYDFIDVVRQAMVDYAAELLPLIKAAHDKGDDAEYTRLYQLYLQLMLDLDEMLSYDENFKLERWTSLARNIAGEVDGTTENDRNWLEWNARTQVTVWSSGNTDLHDYSNRCWAGLIKDFHYERWKYFFENNGAAPNGGWFSGFEYPWTVDFNETYDLAGDYSQIVIPNDMTATEKAAETFGKYFGRVKGATKNYIFPMGVARKATKSDVIPEVYRGQTVELPLIIGKNVTITSVWVDLNNDGAKGNGETLTATNNQVAIPADAAIGKTTAQVVYSDGTDITFNLALVEDIDANRTVTAVAGANGSVAIEGTNELSISNTEAVKMTATANTGYNFENWTDAGGNVVSNDNPFVYYGKEAATFTANFIQDKWGVVACNGAFSGDIAGYKQFIHNLTFAYYNREAETIFETTTAPTEIFNTIPQIVNVPQGASFTVSYDDGDGDGLKYCYFRAFIDLNQDGDFDDEGELLKEVGTNGGQNTAVCSNAINVLLPYDMPLGITHMRLRFDGAWDNGNNPSGRGAKDASIRPVYEIIINVTDKSDKAATINVETNSTDWGTVEVWTDETPDGSTGTTWEVSANIPMYLRATKASEDVEFLGWYDQYDRLLTSELEYSMLAREDATYTARFRKFLEIDGWQFEYRTEPGDELRVKDNLANGVKPENGKKYYIAAHTLSSGTYYNRYLYDNGGILATNTTADFGNYVWTCIVNDNDTYSFKNASGNYLSINNTNSNGSNHSICIGATAAEYTFDEAAHEGVALLNTYPNKSSNVVTKHDGTAFDRWSGSVNNGSWSNDFVFTEVSTPDVVVLTNVRESGDHDLEIPETIEILGEQCKIVGFDNNLFANNKDLWSISLPSTIEEMSNNKVFNAVVKGKGANNSADATNYITTDLGTTLAAGEDWSISLTIEDNGNNFNQWGSALIATGNAPMNSTYANGFQLYMQSTSNGGKLIVKLDNDNNNNALASISKGTKYRIDIVYTQNTQLVITATPLTSAAALVAARSANSLTLTQDMSDFNVVSHAIPEGVNITNLEVRKGAAPDPFQGCTNLFDITVADGCEDYYVADRTLYRTGGVELHTLADEDKADELRTLGKLIDNTEALMDVIATSINPVGKATEIAMQSTSLTSDYYIWCSNPHTGDNNDARGGVAALLDEDAGSYLHSNWSSLSTTHDYLQIDNIVNPEGLYDLYNFKIAGQQRNSGSNDRPKNIEIYGSNDKTNWTPITTVEGLPNTAGATWESGNLALDVKYSSLKFVVKTHDNYNQTTTVGRPYFHMAKFDLFRLTSTVEVDAEYQELGGITNDEATNVYDNLVNALYVYNNGGTVAELQAAYDALEPLYSAVNDKKNKVEYVRELNELVPAVDELIDAVTVSTTTGVPVALALTTTEGQPNYIWCNAPTANEGVGNLIDNDPGTILHTAWNAGSVGQYNHYLLITLGEEYKLADFKFRYKARSGNANTMNMGDIPSGIKVYGSNEENGTYEELYTVSGLTQSSGYDWTSPAINAKSYRYLRFNVTANSGFWHMAEFDLFKLIEVAPGYKNFGGITNEEATAIYDCMVNAQVLCNNGTAAELEAALNDLQSKYDALNAKKGKVLNGVYHISFMNGDTEVPMFIGYNEKQDDWEGDDHKGYKILGTDVYTTDVEADKVFTIIPQENGYTISAQGKYLKAIDFNTWNHIQFSDDESATGLYLFHETSLAGIFKIQGVGESDGDWLHNDYLQVYNENGEMIVGPNPEDAASSFALTPATSYAINVPENGLLPLYLPFNVVLPEGMEAFDINDLSKEVLVTAENLLVKIAGAGETVLAGTPVVVKAAPGTHTLAITMDSDGAKTSLEGSVLRGNYAKQNLGIQLGLKKFVLNGNVWENIDNSREIPANTCWIEVEAENFKDDYIDMDPDFVEINDWKFRYEAATNGIKLTYHVENDQETDLVIPEVISIDGVPQKVVAISPDFLHGSTKVTSVKFPASLVNLGFRTVEPMFGDETTVYEGKEGDGGQYDGNAAVGEVVGAHREYEFPIDPATGKPFKVDSKSAWRLTLDVTIDDPSINFNNYGSAIVSTNENTLADSYTDGDMQIYMRAEHKEIIVKIDNADDRYTYTLPELDAEGKETGKLVAHNHFIFELEHDGTGGYQVVIYYDDGRAKMYNISASEGAQVKNFDRFYYSLPKGIRVKVKVDKLISQGLFVGCTNLHEIIVDENNPTFKSCEHGVLYDKNGYYVMRIPEGETSHHFEIPSKVVKLYAGSFHGVKADIVLHSNPQIGVVPGHEDAVKDAKFFLSLDDKDNTITEKETGYGGARDFISTNNNTYQSGRYKRAPLEEGKYGTIVLPFAPTNWKEKYDFFEMTDADATSFHFSPVDELKPNTAYLYKLKDGADNIVMGDEEGLDVFEGGEFTVQTHAKYNPNDETPGGFRALGAYVNYYIETKNYPNSSYYYYNTAKKMFVKVTNKLTYRPYRALFVVTPEEGQAAQAPAQLSLRITRNDGSTTEIDPSQVEGMETPIYYDLQGRRVENPTSGVYIVNGKKVIF